MTKTFFGLIANLALFAFAANLTSAQTPTPTPITKPDPPSVQTPSTVGRIVKWSGVSKSGIGIIGDSIMTENAGGITVGGTFTATGAINTNSQFNLNGARVLGVNRSNLFLGWGTGINNTS